MRRPSTCADTAQGFTLLEVTVALVIAALALAVLFSSGLEGLRATQAASHYKEAIARARSRLTLVAHANPLVAGESQGDDGGGFTWHTRVTPIASTSVQPVYTPTSRLWKSFSVTLYALTVWITWHDGSAHEVRLDSEQIGEAAR